MGYRLPRGSSKIGRRGQDGVKLPAPVKVPRVVPPLGVIQ